MLEAPTVPVNILLVDDRPDGLITMEAVLKSPNYVLFKAGSGQEALAMAFDKDFAVIILDVQMPLMDGFETATILRQRDRSRRTPIIFVTAINKDLHYVYRGYQSGGVDYLTKPFDPIVLRAKVSVFVDLYSKNRQLELQAERLRQSEERVRLLVESARDIIITTSPDGTLTSVSPAFDAILGWNGGEWVGRSFQPLVHAEDISAVMNGFHQVLQGNDIGLFEARFLSSSGNFIVMESSAKPLVQGERITGVLHVARDVSARKQVEEERRRRYELERSNKELEEFASICSHDLQEPLRQVVSFTQLIRKKFGATLPADGEEYFDFLISGTKRMSDLVKDLLDYSRLGAPDLRVKPIPAAGIVSETVTILQYLIKDNDARVSVGDLPEILGNQAQLVRLFQNLIANSIKFRSGEPPRIHVDAKSHGRDCIFSVTDNGIGFDMEYAERVFLIFRRLHHQTAYPGTGVGLASCKKIVERHGGRIWVNSQPGKGTTFYFSLPRAEAAIAEADSASLPTATACQTGLSEGNPVEVH